MRYTAWRWLLGTAMNVVCLLTYAQTPGEWTWMNGKNVIGSTATGVWGTKGVADAANTPPSVYEPAGWVDLQGNFWMFGGFGSGTGPYSDMWKYNVATNQWTWMKGPGTPNVAGTYGTQGVPAANNNPGARKYTAATWVDKAGDLWFFGGNGLSNGGYTGNFNDLWRYNIATNQWTWMKGSSNINQAGVYGSMGTSSSTTTPGARSETSATWTDNDGNLWLFGGQDNNYGFYNDMWKYNVSTNEWTWVHGSSGPGATPANYGTKGVASSANIPNGRSVYCKWKDKQGNFWIFGGGGNSYYPPSGGGLVIDSYNDLWKYDVQNNQWVWISGADTANDPGYYGSDCTAGEPMPSSRWKNEAAWTDTAGNFWLFGGLIYTGGNNWVRNDLWHYNVSTNKWTWVDGSAGYGQASVYGTKLVSDSANIPGCRYGALGWADKNTNYLWLFGGSRSAGSNNYNDLWRYVPGALPTSGGGTGGTVHAGTITAPKDIVCMGASVQLTVNGSKGNISWQSSADGILFTDMVADTTAIYTANSINQASYYRVKAHGQCGTDSSAVFRVTVYTPPVPVVATNDSLICASDSALITSSGSYVTYRWNNGDTRPYTYGHSAGGYWVTVQDANGCTGVSQHQQVTVYPVPSVSLVVKGDTLTSFGAESYQWYYNNEPIYGATSSVYIANGSGQYAVEIVDANGCKAMSNYTSVLITGIESLDGHSFISVYPSPFSDKFFIKTAGSIPASVTIYDDLGRVLLLQQADVRTNVYEINTSALPAGCYYIRVKTTMGEWVQKMLKL